MISLKDFGAALAAERRERYSLANLSKNMGGISKDDIRSWEAGLSAPRGLEIKQLIQCFPKLKPFEEALRRGEYEGAEKISEVRIKAPKPHKPAATRLPAARQPSPPRPTPTIQPQSFRRAPVEIVNPVAPAPLSFQPFTPKALTKTRGEMLADLGKIVTKRLGNHTAEDHDFTIKNDGKHLIIKLFLVEKEENVDSGCYIAVGPREPHGLGVFEKIMASGNYAETSGRCAGVIELLQIAKILHDAVKDRRFE